MEVAIAWSVAAVVLGALAWDFGRRWLQRPTRIEAKLSELVKELEGTQSDAGKRFDHIDMRFNAVESMVKNVSPNFNPLGRNYDPKRAG